jgi:multiple sugar transport system substrate-binding protein
MNTRTRLFTLVSLLMAVAMLLTACAVPTPQVVEKIVEKPVEKIVEKPVEKVVQQTVVVKETQVVKEQVVVTPTPLPKPTAVPSPTIPPPVLTQGEGCAAGAKKITWYIGLGAGTQPDDVAKEKAWVDQFNKSQTEACVVMNVVYNTGTNSYDALKALIAGGNAPDIVGPVGKMGRASFQGAWADIEPLAKAAGFDLAKYDPALLDFTKDEGVLVGIPFALFPSFVYYNKALFDEARLPYPPHKVGEKYNGKDWNLDTFTELARKLTVDKWGNDATMKEFDAKNIKQFGFFPQWTDARGLGTFFGGGLPFDPKDTKTAVLPDAWKQAWKWFYDGIWKNNFIPNADYINSDLLAKSNVGSSSNVGMWWTHTWYTCCFDLQKTKWDIGVVPTINGKITAKLHGDTFAILKDSKNKDVAFKVLSKMVVAQELYQIYGGMPAQQAQRAEFFAALDKRAAPNKVDWTVAEAMLKYPDLPNHEAWLPNMIKANSLFSEFRTKMEQTPGLDMDKEIAKLQSDLDVVFKEAK